MAAALSEAVKAAHAETLPSGPLFDETAAWVSAEKPELRTKAAVVVTVTNVFVCQPGPDLGKDIWGE